MKNINKPAPLWFRRLETALLFLIMGAIPILGLSKMLPIQIRDEMCFVFLPGLTLLIKAIGIGLGENPPPEEKKD